MVIVMELIIVMWKDETARCNIERVIDVFYTVFSFFNLLAFLVYYSWTMNYRNRIYDASMISNSYLQAESIYSLMSIIED